jgi:hypothetical protein
MPTLPTSHPWTTAKVVLILKTSYWIINYLLRKGRLPSPPKDEKGHFQWHKKHIDRLRRILAERRLHRDLLR